MAKLRTTRREIESMLTTEMRRRYPTTRYVALMPIIGGFRCFVRWQLSPNDKTVPPNEDAEALLADLLRRFEIVEQ